MRGKAMYIRLFLKTTWGKKHNWEKQVVMSKVCIYCASRTPNRGILKSVLAEILGPVKNTTGRHLFWGTATIRVKIKSFVGKSRGR